jgi:hypothetical protein
MNKPEVRKFSCGILLVILFFIFSSTYILAQNDLNTENATAVNEAAESTSFMFVQNAQSGSLVPIAGEENLYNLTLTGVAPQTIAFSDRPERIVVQVEMQKFLDGSCISSNDPPNAAIEILDADEKEDVAVVELSDPVYDRANYTLRYNVSFLKEPNLSYAAFNERADSSLPEKFGAVSLFIDSCPPGNVCCFAKGEDVLCARLNSVPFCWSWAEGCHACRDQTQPCSKACGGKQIVEWDDHCDA